MPKKFRVYGQQTMSVSVDVEFTDEQLAEIAVDLDTEVEKLTDTQLRMFIADRTTDADVGGLCVQCSGWDQPWSRDDDGEIEWDESDDGVREVTGE